MRESSAKSSSNGGSPTATLRAAAFSERAHWHALGANWRQLHGSFHGSGISFEWHDFECAEEIDWGKSFHPNSVEMCLNLAGTGTVSMSRKEAAFSPLTAGFYRRGNGALRGVRHAGMRHQFLTVELSFEFLREHLRKSAPSLHPVVREVIQGGGESSTVVSTSRLGSRQQQLLASLREPPVLAAAQALWYQSKALELAAELFFLPDDGQELFCQRQQRIAAERVEKVIALLRANLSEPLALEEIGRSVGCSPFHLSRTFSNATGMTIPQYTRQLRMERAAELLRTGKCNVTEAAMEVGYSSLSHFSQAFHEVHGCCPGLYPLRTPAQQSAAESAESRRQA